MEKPSKPIRCYNLRAYRFLQLYKGRPDPSWGVWGQSPQIKRGSLGGGSPQPGGLGSGSCPRGPLKVKNRIPKYSRECLLSAAPRATFGMAGGPRSRAPGGRFRARGGGFGGDPGDALEGFENTSSSAACWEWLDAGSAGAINPGALVTGDPIDWPRRYCELPQ